MKKIRGKYNQDSNFTTVFSNNTIYTIAKGTGEWGYLPVGGMTPTGNVLTQKEYDRLASRCEKVGTFVLH